MTTPHFSLSVLMADIRSRSLNALLTRFSIAAFAVLLGSALVGGIAVYRAVDGWEANITPRLAHAIEQMLDRQARTVAEQTEARAYSDEAITLVRRPSSAGAKGRLTVDETRSLARHGYTFALVVDTTGRVAFAWTREGAFAAPPPLTEALHARMDSLGTIGGYLRDGDVVWLIGGTPLRPPGGARAGGYFVLGQQVDTAFLARLGADISAKLSVHRDTSVQPLSRRVAGGDSLVVRRPLRDVSGAPLAMLEARFDRHALNRLLRWGTIGFALLLAVGTVALAVLWYLGHRLLVAPLRAMARTVEAMQGAHATHELKDELPVAEWEVLRTTFNETVRTLSEFQRRYRDVFDHAADALFVIESSSGRVIDANPATVSITGVATAQMIGQTLPTELLPGGPGQRVVRWRRPDGLTQTWGVAASHIGGEGDPLMLAAFRDLTGREVMAHAQKMEAVGSLAGGIAHDFNNLLGAVLTGTTAARALVGEGHPARAALDGIEHAGTRAAELTRQLLSFSRHDPLRLVPVDLGQAIENVGRICSRTFDRKIVVDAWAPGDLPAVLGDPGEIEQALLNLCINARDAMADGGSLRLEARREFFDEHQAPAVGVRQPGAYVEVTVVDTGTGMTDEVKARLFEPFFTTKEAGRGTGLGLSLVYGLLRQLGGAISVRSVVQHGTRVTLLFPALAERPDRTTPPSPMETPVTAPRTSAGSERPVVLLVDDERALREMLRLVLDLSGFDVIEAGDGASALARFQERRSEIRAILLDVQLPGELTGAETLERVRALDEEIPVLLCTGFAQEDDLSRMRMLSVDDVLLKPVDINALLARLDLLCREPRAGVEA